MILGLEDTISARDNVRIMEREQVAGRADLLRRRQLDAATASTSFRRFAGWASARICEVHLKDNPHYLGEGTIDFPGVVRALADIGFAEWAQLETDSPSKSVEKPTCARNLAFIRARMKEAGLRRARRGRAVRLRPHRRAGRARRSTTCVVTARDDADGCADGRDVGAAAMAAAVDLEPVIAAVRADVSRGSASIRPRRGPRPRRCCGALRKGDAAPAHQLARRHLQLVLGRDASCRSGSTIARASTATSSRCVAAVEGEGYDGIRKDRVNVGGRLTLVDATGPFGNPTSDSARTMVTTTHATGAVRDLRAAGAPGGHARARRRSHGREEGDVSREGDW